MLAQQSPRWVPPAAQGTPIRLLGLWLPCLCLWLRLHPVRAPVPAASSQNCPYRSATSAVISSSAHCDHRLFFCLSHPRLFILIKASQCLDLSSFFLPISHLLPLQFFPTQLKVPQSIALSRRLPIPSLWAGPGSWGRQGKAGGPGTASRLSSLAPASPSADHVHAMPRLRLHFWGPQTPGLGLRTPGDEVRVTPGVLQPARQLHRSRRDPRG